MTVNQSVSRGSLSFERAGDGAEMAISEGTLYLLDNRSRNVDVRFEMSGGFVTARLSHGDWLGAWSAVDLTAGHLEGPWFHLELAGEPFMFRADHPVEFLSELEVQAELFVDMSWWQRGLRLSRLAQAKAASRVLLPWSREKSLWSYLRAPSFHESLRLEAFANQEGSNSLVAGDKRIRTQVAAAQEEIVQWIQVGMHAWLGFYFLLGEGTARERMERAGKGLQSASEQLLTIADDFGTVAESSGSVHLMTYQSVVEGWAGALELIASGALLDQQRSAEQGLSRLVGASAQAEQVVFLNAIIVQRILLADALNSLHELNPSAKIPKAAVERAKEPWRRAIVAAGSPLRW